ncbi:uncharacterized protein LOC109949670 [Prunus persica]|uniref:uncharacterized protein LOC109949670 n=1 Tax=Prunus persica TaxID=3760 RepID=UPI0009AB719E|nr:uncharacterized protein LOC109949670 [Prunus persica]
MDIPDLTWFKVLLLVAKHSSEDLYSMAGTCKLFVEMLNDPEVWRIVSLEKYQWHPEWYGFYQEKLVEFLQKCKEHNNPEIIYREAMFVVLSPVSGLKFRFPKQSFIENDRHPNAREVACCQSMRDYPFSQIGSEPSLIF